MTDIKNTETPAVASTDLVTLKATSKVEGEAVQSDAIVAEGPAQ